MLCRFPLSETWFCLDLHFAITAVLVLVLVLKKVRQESRAVAGKFTQCSIFMPTPNDTSIGINLQIYIDCIKADLNVKL